MQHESYRFVDKTDDTSQLARIRCARVRTIECSATMSGGVYVSTTTTPLQTFPNTLGIWESFSIFKAASDGTRSSAAVRTPWRPRLSLSTMEVMEGGMEAVLLSSSLWTGDFQGIQPFPSPDGRSHPGAAPVQT